MENITTRERIRAIRNIIRAEERRLRARHVWLAHQDFVGLVCLLFGLAAMAAVAVLYLQGALAWWLAIPLMALPISVLHELEHDLIHDLYFRQRPWVQNFMFFIIWYCKLGLNPWLRRALHLRHHRRSGQKHDIEERLIGLGLPFGLLRVLVALHPLASVALFQRIKKDNPDFRPLHLFVVSMPTYIPFLILSFGFVGYAWAGSGWAAAWDPCLLLPAAGWPWVRDLSVLLFFPNILRQTCLILMSSYCHYYEDIPGNDLFYQVQILRSWLLVPFQMFCFNFGATHIIHHYVIAQPFYLRQMIARAAHAELERQGTRVNDLGTVVRANRWQSSVQS